MRNHTCHTARLFLALIFSIAVLATGGCVRRESAVESGIRTQTLHIGNSVEPPDLDPHTNNSAAGGLIIGALFEGLVQLANDGSTILPGVAERWDISSDGRTYTFYLRPNARWSNGDPVTADDMVYGFRRFLEPALGCEGVNQIFAIVGARDYVEGRSKDFSTVGVKAEDAHTVRISVRFRAPFLLQVLGGILPVHRPSLDRFDGRLKRGTKWTLPGNLISNGPFQLQQWTPNVVVAIVRNPYYWNAARVQLNEVHFHPIEDQSTEERAFRSGLLHITYSLPISKLEAYQKRHDPQLRLTPILRTNYITFNTQQPPFNDARVRRAFSLAIDRERLASSILKGLGEPAYSYVRPGTGGYDVGRLSRHDPAEAKRLLHAAGFTNGTRFPSVEYLLDGRSEEVLTIAQALQRMWQETLGVEVQLAPTEFKVELDLLRTRSFTFAANSWNLGFNDPTDLLALGVTGDPNNDASWSNAPYDVAFAAIEKTPDDTARAKAVEICERIIAEEVPYAPVYYANRAHLVHPSVRGWRGNALQAIDWTMLSLVAP